MEKTKLFPILHFGTKEFSERLLRIKSRNFTLDEKLASRVAKIVEAVRTGGDSALIQFTKEFDGVELRSVKVPTEEIDRAKANVSEEMLAIIRQAASNVRAFHEKQIQNSWTEQKDDGSILGQVVIPLNRVALYVPGGTAAYPSTVIMNAVPAQVAGVKEICVLTPPNEDGSVNRLVLATCSMLGIQSVYSVGGAQAIAAAAYGTETIRKVDKIVGPGNLYVAAAKRMVYGDVDIDMIAGPSEVVVLADSTAEAKHVAADLLAQAEHDKNAAAILITTDQRLAKKIQRRVNSFVSDLTRKVIAGESIRRNGAAFIVKDISEAVSLVNEIAPEHLEIIAENEWEILGQIRNAGAVFLGKYSPEPVGDYFAGPSHVLPTGGTARFSSVLSVESFVKRSSVIHYSKKAFERDSTKIKIFAENEGLTAHALSIQVREKVGRKK